MHVSSATMAATIYMMKNIGEDYNNTTEIALWLCNMMKKRMALLFAILLLIPSWCCSLPMQIGMPNDEQYSYS